jgi:hypothetical protein
MKPDRTMALVRAVYDEVHLALWAVLTALVIYFSVFVAPKLPKLQAAAERHRIERIASQDDAYCAKWRMGPASAMHDECISDLQQLRTNIENRIAEESAF